MSALENAARALCRNEARRYLEGPVNQAPMNEEVLDLLVETSWQNGDYLEDARAVLSAVRFETLEDDTGSVMAHRFWFNDRIDAILNEETA